VGTGGSARAAVAAATSLGVAFQSRSRNPDRATAFETEMAGLGARRGDAAIGLVVNCTPLGLNAGDGYPLPVEQHPPGAAALDLVYRQGATAWIRALRSRGHRAIDGRTTLLGQGAAAFECWFPRVRPPIEVMRAALDHALR
jgi:shikimate dehydrogenase